MHCIALESFLSVHLTPSERQKPLQILILWAAVSVTGAIWCLCNEDQKHKMPSFRVCNEYPADINNLYSFINNK